MPDSPARPIDAPDRPAADADVVVVGAGVAGLVAARRLADAGRSVVVVDKGRGVGGRLATRRLGDARLDHGAQFFTVRSGWFAEVVDGWLARGVAREWCRGFSQGGDPAEGDGHPRYVGAGGMTDLAKDLAHGLDVRVGTRVAAIAPAGAGWAVPVEGGPALRARAVLATAPVPQLLDLLAAGGTTPDAPAAAALAAIRYDPCLAALVVTDGPTAVPEPGGVQGPGGLLSWVGDNAAKGVSAVPALTLHAAGPASAERLEDPAAASLAALLDAGTRWLGRAAVVEAQLQRWRYAQPTVGHDGRHLVVAGGAAPLVAAGDAFGEAKVEGAARSGWSAAGAVLERLG